jgi:hypothetical protein
VSDRKIDDALQKAGRLPEAIDPQLVARIANSLKSDLRPVKPLPSPWMFAAGLATICALVAIAGATRLGFYGFDALGMLARGLIFSTLIGLSCVLGMAFAAHMIPGSRHILSTRILLAVTVSSLLFVFALLFHDYHTSQFVSAGLGCLQRGLLHAIPAGLLAWLLLRRGFALDPVVAGMVGGTLAGLAGVGLLELWCANFQALHILVWHVAVVPAAAVAGAALGWAFRQAPGKI